MTYADDIEHLPLSFPDAVVPTNVRRGTIRLAYQMAFNLACVHTDHPARTTFAKGSQFSAELWSNGEAIVTGVFHDHTFRFSRDQYEVTE